MRQLRDDDFAPLFVEYKRPLLIQNLLIVAINLNSLCLGLVPAITPARVLFR